MIIKKLEKKTFSVHFCPVWYRCYYPHRSRVSVSPECGIFFITGGIQVATTMLFCGRLECEASNHVFVQIKKLKLLVSKSSSYFTQPGYELQCPSVCVVLSLCLSPPPSPCSVNSVELRPMVKNCFPKNAHLRRVHFPFKDNLMLGRLESQIFKQKRI